MGFRNVTIIKMIEHLKTHRGEIDYIDIQEMKKERDAPWNTNDHIVTYFSKIERTVKWLELAEVKSDKNELLSNALYAIKESGEMEHALREWDNKKKEDRTWKNAKRYFSQECANDQKHKSIEAKQAGFGSANQAKKTTED